MGLQEKQQKNVMDIFNAEKALCCFFSSIGYKLFQGKNMLISCHYVC